MRHSLSLLSALLDAAQVPLSDRAAQASSSLVQYDKNSTLTGLLKSVGMVSLPFTYFAFDQAIVYVLPALSVIRMCVIMMPRRAVEPQISHVHVYTHRARRRRTWTKVLMVPWTAGHPPGTGRCGKVENNRSMECWL